MLEDFEWILSHPHLKQKVCVIEFRVFLCVRSLGSIGNGSFPPKLNTRNDNTPGQSLNVILTLKTLDTFFKSLFDTKMQPFEI